ncbi:universal stress protein [Acinetobacter rongchengensis]|uniref:Universal stress protein n=1 Tax=Acinetobacter rongchengensis TaxID=2419601 RepID=A0A3A8EXC4_9GAMM|nr:universal stress protein [Acinetobacter rongchengensis]RKG38769.1 universal stress protein [Acinetobacter rongchengensis]
MLYKHILLAIDDSPISYAAIAHAEKLAIALNCKVTVTSVIAVDPFKGVDFYKVAPAVTQYLMEAEQNVQNRLKDVQETLIHHGVSVVETKIVRELPPATGILEAADELNADLIVMGSHGRTGFKKFFLGSVAQEVLSISPLPVLIIKSVNELE